MMWAKVKQLHTFVVRMSRPESLYDEIDEDAMSLVNVDGEDCASEFEGVAIPFQEHQPTKKWHALQNDLLKAPPIKKRRCLSLKLIVLMLLLTTGGIVVGAIVTRQSKTVDDAGLQQLLLIGGTGIKSFYEIYVPDHPELSRQLTVNKIKQRRFHTAVWYHGNIVILGGDPTNNNRDNKTFIVNPFTNLWTDGPSTWFKRGDKPGAVVFNNSIILCGGQDREYQNKVDKLFIEYTSSCEILTSINGSWDDFPSMNVNRSRFDLVLLDSQIYAIGGINGNASVLTTERFNPTRDAWDILSPMPIPLHDASAVAFHEDIWVCGSTNALCNESSVCQIYSPSNNSWSLGPTMQFPRCSYSLVSYNDTLVALGGVKLKTVEIYSTNSSMWRNGRNLIDRRKKFSVVLV